MVGSEDEAGWPVGILGTGWMDRDRVVCVGEMEMFLMGMDNKVASTWFATAAGWMRKWDSLRFLIFTANLRD